jgi:hypothetical protein
MATHFLQKCWLVDGLWHVSQYCLPQLLQVVKVFAFLPQISHFFVSVAIGASGIEGRKRIVII